MSLRLPAHARTALFLALSLAACGDSKADPEGPDAGPDGRPDAGEPAADASSPEPTDAGDGAMPEDDGGMAGDGDASVPEDDAGTKAPAVMFRVLTLNSWNKGADVVADDIRAANADVVGLQEVSPSEAESITEALGGGWSFVQEDRANTVAILSKHPILERVGVVPDGRGGVGVSVAVGPKLRAHVFVAHLMYTPYGPYQLQDGMSVADVVESEENVRMPELRALLALTEPTLASDEATFLIGDFNAPSHLDYEPAMPWPSSVVPVEAGFVDSYAVLHPERVKKWACEFSIDDPGITWAQFTSVEPHGCFDRIDFVYGSANDAEPRESITIDAASSDHRAVLSTFALREIEADTPVPSLPSDGQTGVSRHALLSWAGVAGSTASRVFLGQGDALTMVGETASTHLVSGLLDSNTTYTFRVDAVTPEGVVSGTPRSFTTRTSAGLAPDALEYAPGTTITVRANGADAAKDWIGLYGREKAYGSGHPATVWKYLNDSQSAPGAVVTDGRVTFTAPNEPGEYVLRLLHDDGYRVEDELTIRVR